MKEKVGAILVSLALGCVPGAGAEENPEVADQWPQWRGPLGTGVAPHGTPPIKWADDHNLNWKVELPGHGHSTPIIWHDRIFVTTAVPYGDAVEVESDEHSDGAHDNMSADHAMRFVVLGLDRADGRVVWQREVARGRPHEAAHVTASWASPSPVTDGERVIASFGSRGIFALDSTGKLLWQIDLGDMRIRHSHGEGSSPALSDGTVVVNWDHQGGSFLVALDAETGRQRWRVSRNEITSWSTPLIVEHEGGKQVIVSATERVRSYDLASGRLLWECSGLSRNVVASPVAGDGFVYVANSYDWQALLAIRLAGAKGDISESASIVWRTDRHTSYVPSPLLDRGVIFFLAHNQGIVTGLDAKTGKVRYASRRVPGVRNVFASPVAADGRLYITSREGTTAVFSYGDDLELLTINRLEDSFSASPAIVGRVIYLRGKDHLYSIAKGAPAPLED